MYTFICLDTFSVINYLKFIEIIWIKWMLNKNLLCALVISLLTLLGIYSFSNMSAVLNIGLIATLAVSTLAWLFLLMFSQYTSEKKLAKNQDTNTVAQTVNSLFNAFQSELNTQISATEAELAQVKSLIDNAIDGLVDSFISLEASTRTEQSLLILLTSNELSDDSNSNNSAMSPFKQKQLKSKQLLSDIASQLNTLIKNTNQNGLASKALKKIEKEAESTVKNLELILDKLGNTVDAIFIDELRNNAHKLHRSINQAGSTADELYADSQLYALESKDIASKINLIMDENASNVAIVAEEIAAATMQIEKDVQAAIKSLQFQDMTTQLITQCSERQKLMQNILTSIDIGENNNNISIQELEVKFSAAHAKLKQVSSVRMKQFNIDGGSVELF